MKLISLNIELNKHNLIILDFLKKEKADVICLQEILEEDFPFFNKELNLESVFQVCRYQRSPFYPQLIGKKQGVAIFSKNIINSGSVFYLGSKEDTTKPFDSVNFKKSEALVWANIKSSEGASFKFVTAQLPVTENGEVTPFQLEVLDSFLMKLDKLGELVLCGDINGPRGRETFDRLAKKYKDNIPPEYKTSLDQNLHRVKGLIYVVDGLFTTPNYKASNVRLIDGVSDHMAIVADIKKN